MLPKSQAPIFPLYDKSRKIADQSAIFAECSPPELFGMLGWGLCGQSKVWIILTTCQSYKADEKRIRLQFTCLCPWKERKCGWWLYIIHALDFNKNNNTKCSHWVCHAPNSSGASPGRTWEQRMQRADGSLPEKVNSSLWKGWGQIRIAPTALWKSFPCQTGFLFDLDG